MGTALREVVYDEHGIGGGGKYCGNNDAQLGCINVIYHEASGRKYVPRAVLFCLGPGVIDPVRASPLGELFCQEPLHKSWARVMLNPSVV
jgi:tubulin beta